MDRQQLFNAYSSAGTNFLAERLKNVFRRIENDRDRVLHNEMTDEIAFMIGEVDEGDGNPPLFLREIANILLHEKFEPKKKFLGFVAAKILQVAGLKKEF